MASTENNTQTLTAKFKSTCVVCGDVITPGSQIKYNKAQGSWHASCEQAAEAPAGEVFEVSGVAGGKLGFRSQLSSWKQGDVVHNVKREAGSTRIRKASEIRQRVEELGDDPRYHDNPNFPVPEKPTQPPTDFEVLAKVSDAERARKEASDNWRAACKAVRSEYPDNDGPEFFTVLRIVKSYTPYYDDGESGGEVDYTAYCREATAEEAAPRIEAEQRKARAAEAREQLKAVAREIQETGERPAKAEHPRGEKVVLSKGHYQDNEYLVIAEDFIWRVFYNGRDGDDWSYNNLSDSVGDRVPYTEELAARIRQLQEAARG